RTPSRTPGGRWKISFFQCVWTHAVNAGARFVRTVEAEKLAVAHPHRMLCATAAPSTASLRCDQQPQAGQIARPIRTLHRAEGLHRARLLPGDVISDAKMQPRLVGM